MPTFDIVKENKADKNSFRVANIIGMFDLQNEHIKEHFVGNIELPDNWNVGIIYGASGTGKTTIANELFKENIIENFDYNSQSVIDDMPKNKTVKDIVKTFNSVGFSSPPSWLKPYKVLSNGEKMRVDLANALLSDKNLICFDEFTSVVNREVAKVASYAISKCVKKQNKKFIALSCHYDIIEWLEPDWTFCTDTMQFEICKKKDQKLNVQYMNATKTCGKFLESIII